MGQKEKDFYIKASANFIHPLKSFIDGQMMLIEKEVKQLELKRLDLGAAKSKSKRSNSPNLNEDLENVKSDYYRQLEFTKQSVGELQLAYKEHGEYLKSFVSIQKEYYKGCLTLLENLEEQIAKEKEEPKQEDSKQEEPKQEDSKQEDSKQEEPKQVEEEVDEEKEIKN